MVPLLTKAVEEGREQGIFNCDDIPERVRMMLVLSGEIFDEESYTDKDVDVFIDIMEKMFGAETGSMHFVRQLIGGSAVPDDTRG